METSKNNLRRQLQIKRDAIDKCKRDKDSALIVNRLLAMKEIKNAEMILAFHPIRSEVDLRMFMEDILSQGKLLGLPRVSSHEMNFYQVKDLAADLEKGSFGLMEPKTDLPLLKVEKGLCIVPGLGFDSYRNRIGYGKGYYDKYLGEHTGLITVGVAFEEQFCRVIPTDKYDRKLDYIISPNQVIKE